MEAVVIFEDALWSQFLPLTYTRPVCELRCGTGPLWGKIKRFVPHEVELHIHTRSHLTETLRNCIDGVFVNEFDRLDGKATMFVNGRLLISPEQPGSATDLPTGTAFLHNGELLGASLSKSATTNLLPHLAKPWDDDATNAVLEATNGSTQDITGIGGISLLHYPWDIINNNAGLITSEFPYIATGGTGTMDPNAYVYGGNRSEVHLGAGALIHPTVVLDVHQGPIYIGDNTEVFPHTRIEGPSYIGRDVQIVGGKIREGCHIGDICRVGGEVEESIFHGYSNKYHDGSLGHAYVGEWVNLGSLTTNSDLKDTYGSVRIKMGDERIEAGMKVGCFIGDHVKTSIGTLIYTGKRIGFASHVHGVVTDDIPSFTISAKSIGDEGNQVELLFDSVIETHRRVLGRRKTIQTDTERELLQHLFKATADERKMANVRTGRPSL